MRVEVDASVRVASARAFRQDDEALPSALAGLVGIGVEAVHVPGLEVDGRATP